MSADKIIHAAEIDYDRSASIELRRELIAMRDKSLAENDFAVAVKLSHIIAWMYVIIEERWPE